MLVRSADGEYESIGWFQARHIRGRLTHPDFRETAPAAAHRDMYKGNILGSVWSGLASGVPGDLRGLEYLHNKYGVSTTIMMLSTTLLTAQVTTMEISVQSGRSRCQIWISR